jgi:cytohesin
MSLGIMLALLITAAAVVWRASSVEQAVASDRAWTTLHQAARDGHIEQVETLIRQGANPDARDEQGKTALHYAAANGHNGTVHVLLTHGADTTLRDDIGRTAIEYARDYGHTATAGEFLVSASAGR